ncbi:MAG: hypothetical protein NC312_07055 [Bacteroides fragilis]|nr:hypothetical protein [Bacteroides fragilis]
MNAERTTIMPLLVLVMEKVMAVLRTYQLDNNLPPILPQLSNNEPHAPRSYAAFSDFQSKK